MATKKAAGTGGNVDEGKLCAILAYLLVGIIWYFADEKMKKNTFVKFHVKQGIVVILTSLILSVIGVILPWTLGWIISLLQLGLLVLAILGIINAVNGQKKEVLIIGQFAKKLTF